jgi:hypothetical protein
MARKWALAVLLLLAGVVGPALAGTTATYTITVTVEEILGVSISSPTWALGNRPPGTYYILNLGIPQPNVGNTGNVTEDFSFMQTKAADWTPLETIAGVGTDTYVLAVRLMVQYTPVPPLASYVDGDVVTQVAQWCDGIKFGGLGYIKGPGTGNYFFPLLKVPIDSTSSAEQTIVVTIGCRRHY